MVMATIPTLIALTSLERVSIAKLVILTAFRGIRKYSHRLINPLESLIGIWRIILVRMNFQAFFLICSFQILFCYFSIHSQH